MEAENAKKPFCRRVIGVPLTSVDVACVNELGSINRKEKELQSSEILVKTLGNASLGGTAKKAEGKQLDEQN
jgi:hypothetical protein